MCSDFRLQSKWKTDNFKICFFILLLFQEHFNFTSDSSSLGSLLLSLKFEENCAGCDEKDGDIVRIILRYD